MTGPILTERPDDPATFRFFNEVGIIEHLARTAQERVMPLGLSHAGFGVLNHLVRLGHVNRPPARIAMAMQVTKGAMTGTLQRLEAQGWVMITADPGDGRAKFVNVTPAGRAVRGLAVARLQPLFDDLTKQISEQELAAAMPTLEKVRKILDAARD